MQEVMRRSLAKAGYAVVQARDGPEALAILATGPLPDIVLLDAHMPGISG